MNIAILGWGSLVWDKRDLPIVGNWQQGGPVLPIEFSRISSDGRLTLVIDERNGVDVMTRYAHSECANLNGAVESLKKSEETPTVERIGFVDLVSNTERASSRLHHPTACDRIKAWAQAHNWEAIVWTALQSNFKEKVGEPFSADAAVRYLNHLTGESKRIALEYIQKAPQEVNTPFRRLVFANANSL